MVEVILTYAILSIAVESVLFSYKLDAAGKAHRLDLRMAFSNAVLVIFVTYAPAGHSFGFITSIAIWLSQSILLAVLLYGIVNRCAFLARHRFH